MKRGAWIAIGIALATVAILAFIRAQEAGYTSAGRHAWTVAVEHEGPWRVIVPALVPRPVFAGAHDVAALDALMGTLHVGEGSATFTLTGEALRIEGTGNATLVAERSVWDRAHREAFNDWAAPLPNATREDGGTGTLRVEWIVEFSGGRGHTCWANARTSVLLEPGESRALFDASETNLPGRPWNSVCA